MQWWLIALCGLWTGYVDWLICRDGAPQFFRALFILLTLLYIIVLSFMLYIDNTSPNSPSKD